MESQIMYLKAVLLWAELAIDVDQDGPEHPSQGERKLILMAVILNVLDIKLMHYSFTIQPCSLYLDWLL